MKFFNSIKTVSILTFAIINILLINSICADPAAVLEGIAGHLTLNPNPVDPCPIIKDAYENHANEMVEWQGIKTACSGNKGLSSTACKFLFGRSKPRDYDIDDVFQAAMAYFSKYQQIFSRIKFQTSTAKKFVELLATMALEDANVSDGTRNKIRNVCKNWSALVDYCETKQPLSNDAKTGCKQLGMKK